MNKLKISRILYQIFNILVLLLSIGIFVISIYLWIETKKLNSVIILLFVIGIYILLTSVFSVCWTGKSACAHLLSSVLYVTILVANIVLGFYIAFDQESVVDFMTKHMDNSEDTIEEIRNVLNKNLDAVKILFLSYTIVVVSFNNLAFKYFHSMQN
jgi:hypothetical protein